MQKTTVHEVDKRRIPHNDLSNPNEDFDSINDNDRQQSTSATSSPQSDSLRTDCILVYGHNDDSDNDEDSYNSAEPYMSPLERRERFEDYLKSKQHLILQTVESPSTKKTFVKVHTPFKILLKTAEKMRMGLPIEKIEENKNNALEPNKSCWNRFTTSLKRPFRLDESLSKHDPDYYTAIYSSNNPKFEHLFHTLRGSKELYFTPSERSLLTYELLTRAHSDDHGENLAQAPPIGQPKMNTVAGLRKGVRRPGIDRLIAKKAYESYFPLHEPFHSNVRNINDDGLNDREVRLNDRQKLKKYWATMRQCFKFQPLFLIRSYMGEKVAFYFALTGFYNQMLIPPALVGLIIFIYGVASVFTDTPTSDICGSYGQSTYMCPRCDKICPFWKLSESCVYSKISYVFDNTATVVFAILMSLWARWFVEFWKRREAVLRYEWDSINFDSTIEPIRPAYETKAEKMGGERRTNPVTEINEPYIPRIKQIPSFILSVVVVIVTIAIVCVTIFCTIIYRVQMDYLLKNTSVKTYSSIIITITSAIVNLICSLILSLLYYWIAGKITDLELHKYQSKYDNSLIMKIYLFQFVNFYASLFYIAFFKGRSTEYPSNYGEPGKGDFTEQCDPAGCLVELSIQLLIIMIGMQIVSNLWEFIYAMGRTCTRLFRNHGKKYEDEPWEEDYNLYDFNSIVLIDEYLELVIQFGFVTLFAVAFPLAPLFALINNLVELRLDAWKLLTRYKRPIPFKAADIGIWSDIFSGVSYLAVLTNAIVIAWTSEFIPKMAYRILQSTGSSLSGYVDWTLTSISIADYNNTGRMPPDVPGGLTSCRYRDFRSSAAPYSESLIYWNVLAARLAFIIVFEHAVFFIIYIMNWLVPDVPKTIQNKIDHERYIDQRERWTTHETTDEKFKQAAVASEAISKMRRPSNNLPNSTLETKDEFPARQSKQKKHKGIRVSPAHEQ
ncbi:unnamed protein product [Adineta steineri]|uniref:Anoctamin n=1 Tax=Adineta steineri TaxID=433720 RepID=A0A818Y871_9BILA|nr:unnamed protein product [Adineta steineri]